MIEVAITAGGLLFILAVAVYRARAWAPVTERGRRHPTGARVGYALGVLAAFLLYGAFAFAIFWMSR